MCFPREQTARWFIAGSNLGHREASGMDRQPDGESRRPRCTTAASSFPSLRGCSIAAETGATWPVLEEQWPHYRDYEKTAKRDIRIFRLGTQVMPSALPLADPAPLDGALAV